MKFIRVNVARYNRKLSWRLRSVLLAIDDERYVMGLTITACTVGLVFVLLGA